MKILHTMLRVFDLERSITFYTEVLGMQLRSKQDFPGGRFTLAFVGYDDDVQIELTHNWDQEQAYDLGTAYGHIALAVDDIYQTCSDIEQKGGQVVRQPGPMKHGTTVLAFVKDPDGYMVELIQQST